MGKIWLIIQREYITRVRKKSFLIGTLLAPVGFALFFVVTVLISGAGISKKKVMVVDDSGFFKNRIADSKSLYFFFQDLDLENALHSFDRLGFDALLYIPVPRNLDQISGLEYRSEKQLGLKDKEYIESEIKRELRRRKLLEINLDESVLQKLEKTEVRLKTIVLGESGEKKGNTALATALGYIMGFAIYIVMFVYGTMVMRGVMEEKTNRIVEVMLSTTKPFQLMVGKIVGIGAVGLTQFLLWFVLIAGINFLMGLIFAGQLAELNQLGMQGAADVEAGQAKIAALLSSFSDINFWPIIGGFLFYFLGGYLFYGSLFAAIGSATSDDGDNQSLTIPVTIPIVASIVIMMQVIYNPDSGLAFWSSVIPFSSPIVMPARIPFGVPFWEIALSGVCLIGGFLLTTWFAARIYRVGILMYGKKVSLREMVRWVRQG